MSKKDDNLAEIAASFASRHKGRLFFSQDAKKWFFRNGQEWERDSTQRHMCLIRELCREWATDKPATEYRQILSYRFMRDVERTARKLLLAN